MTIGISLGWNCAAATHGVQIAVRKTKEQGYKTCPFDVMISNYKGIVQCFEDDFANFFDLTLLQMPNDSPYMKNDLLIYNPTYKFLFNHESPGHGNLWQNEKWVLGINHYTDDDFLHFKGRYKKRIENLKKYLESGEDIHFIISYPDIDYTFNEFKEVLGRKYPNLRYKIENIGLTASLEHYNDHMKLLGI